MAWGLFLEVVRQALASLLTTFGVLCMALNAASVYTGTSKQTLLTPPHPLQEYGVWMEVVLDENLEAQSKFQVPLMDS